MCIGLGSPKVPAPPRPQLPRPAPKRVDESVTNARRNLAEQEARRRGLASTFRVKRPDLMAPPNLSNKELYGE